MATKIQSMTAALVLATIAGGALAAPRIVSFGTGPSVTGISADGTVVSGALSGTATRFTIGPNSITASSMAGSSSASHVSDNGLTFAGVIANSGGLGGLSTTATLTARWTASSGAWSNIGLFPTPPGQAASSGVIHNPRGISQTGRYIAGQGYATATNFRGFVWDRDGNAGAGKMYTLTTSGTTTGRALQVSADGSVVLGGEAPNTSNGRAIVYRYDSGTDTYVASYLPNGIDPATNQPYTGTVDNMFMNPAGNIIVGMSFEYNTTLGFPEGWLTRWNWNSGTNTWDRTLLAVPTLGISSWYNNPSCPIAPNFIPVATSDDASRIVGILPHSTCGSFVRGGFIYNSDTGLVQDLYDWMVAQGTPGMSDFAPPAGVNVPPRLGYPADMSNDGNHIIGFGGPQTSGGPAWIWSSVDTGCVTPNVTLNPSNVTFSRCSTFIMNAGAGGSGPLTYQWNKNGNPVFDGPTGTGSSITGTTTSQLRITKPNPNDAGSYTCTITGSCGSATTAAGIATADPAAPQVANDTCATAQEVNEGTFTYNACGAYIDDLMEVNCQPNNGTTADMWYRYTPTFTGDVRISTCGTGYDTVLTAFDICGGNEIACNNDYDTGSATGCSSTRSRIARLAVQQGVPILIRASAVSTITATGQLVIAVAPAAAANDSCYTATTAIVGANPFDTTEATNDSSVSCATTTVARDVWFTFTAPLRGKLRLATCPGTTWNTVVSIHDGCFGAVLACNDNANITNCSTQSIINNFAMSPAQEIKIRVAGNSATAFGTGTLNLSFACAADFNGDTVLDFFDYLDFVAAFSVADPTSDYNSDNTIDFFDYLDFVADFSTGCGN